MDNATIQRFLDEHDYDVRKTHNGRWIDQKCTMDVVCLVSDCIVEYTSNKPDKTFTVNDIWFSDYTVENVLKEVRTMLVSLIAMLRKYRDIASGSDC